MTTRTTKKTITVDSTVYVACDGKEFDNLKLCVAHEEDLKRAEQRAKLKDIETTPNYFLPLDGCEYNEDHTYTWYRPKSIEEIELLVAYYELESNELTEEDIGEWVCIEENDFDDVYIAYIKDCIEHITHFLREFGYDVTVTKRESTDTCLDKGE